MVKPNLGMFSARRKSSVNVLDDVLPVPQPEAAPAGDGGGFRVLDRAELLRRKEEQRAAAEEKKNQERSSKFGRFSGFGISGNKARNQSFDEDSPSSSKRDSKSSSGTHSLTSRPYNGNQRYYGSSSTLPSSADTDPNDNMFANMPPRPAMPQHYSSPNNLMTGQRKDLPPPPPAKAKTNDFSYSGSQYSPPSQYTPSSGRARAMTTSSYASTAIPPKLEGEMNFGTSNFDDMFSGIDRKESPDYTADMQSPGRSLLAGKRTFQAEPIKIESRLDVEAPLKSWESRGSAERLMSSPSPTEDYQSGPPPVPPHKYAPVASHSPEPRQLESFQDSDAHQQQQQQQQQHFVPRKSAPHIFSTSSSSAASLQTPESSRPASDRTTPRATMPSATPLPDDDDDNDNMFAPPKFHDTPTRKPALPVQKEKISPPAGASGRKVMTDAEFRAQQAYQESQPVQDSSDDEDYEDEEEAIERRQQEEIAARKKQQMAMARDHLRRTTTAPADSNRPSSQADNPSMAFPSEISLQADEWEDEDVPLGILQAHGFPARGRPPTQPVNGTPSYFRTSTPTLPDRPASAGALSTTGRDASYRPPFARNLPSDPHASFIGGGLVRPSVREGMGFNRGPASVAGEPMGPQMLPYHEPQQQYTSLVEQIHLRDMSKAKYTGGASSKNAPQQGPFTGSMGGQMNPMNTNPTRMANMPQQGMMGGMNGAMNGGMNGGMNPMMMAGQMGQMPMMGMNQMGYPMQQPSELMQMQQMLLQQQMQLAAMTQNMYAQHQHPSPGGMPAAAPDPRMSIAQPNGFLGVNGMGMGPQRPMSILSQTGAPQVPRPFSTPTLLSAPGHQHGLSAPSMHLGPTPGYTASIAPSERSNIGLSARYRPVVTGSGMTTDGISTVSGGTMMQASGGAAETRAVKGILKKGGAQVNVVQKSSDEDEDWGAMRERRFKRRNEGGMGGLGELAGGIEGL